MAFRPVLYTIATALLLTTVFSSTSDAQWRGFRQPGQNVVRWLGHGYSAGYHSQTPGPNSDYYNPYSVHNSLLISQQGGGYASDSYSYFGYQPEGASSSSDAPNGTGPGPQNQGGQLITPSFEPAVPEQNGGPDDKSNDSVDDAGESIDDNSAATRAKLRLDSNDFTPASFSRRDQSNTNSNSEWSLDNPFDDKYGQ